LFRYSGERDRLEWVEQDVWRLDMMKAWSNDDIQNLLDIAEDALSSCAKVMRLKSQIIRKPMAVGTTPHPALPPHLT
jgi:IMP and pyridine-specific 5'-nucleotidase